MGAVQLIKNLAHQNVRGMDAICQWVNMKEFVKDAHASRKDHCQSVL
jgi:hypothetical protein